MKQSNFSKKLEIIRNRIQFKRAEETINQGYFFTSYKCSKINYPIRFYRLRSTHWILIIESWIFVLVKSLETNPLDVNSFTITNSLGVMSTLNIAHK